MKRESLYVFSAIVLILGTIFTFSFFNNSNYSNSVDYAANNVNIEETSNIKKENIEYSNNLLSAVDSDTASKDDVYHMMLNSIYYFDKVSGTMLFTSGSIDFINVVDFQCSISDSIAYSNYTQYHVDNLNNITSDSVRKNECTAFKEIFCDSKLIIDVNHFSHQFKYKDHAVITLDNIVPIPDEERFKINNNGQAEIYYLTNPTNVFMSNQCLFPQELTLGYLHDKNLWNIVDTIILDDRECYVIEGIPTKEYSEKLNVINFKFWVDALTGVLVKYEGYDKDNNISQLMYTENLKFEENADSVIKFNTDIIKDYEMKIDD